ncbi:cryptococcal mannosyltransferase 1-domain-containing protein [Aspergillus undulatus]|uniref:cryptococcal mannosyltransferase 1-domain-containing protein n=1 Tax=Aspergillus undulatus TaxID=1810928 RepID=UPI003CCD9BCB
MASVLLRITPRLYGRRRCLLQAFLALVLWTVLDALYHYAHHRRLTAAVAELGPENVFGALRDIDRELDRLGVRRNITLSTITYQNEISAILSSKGWVNTPRGKKELRHFMRPPALYEIFALRDSEGDGYLIQTWPYFRSAQSRSALLSMSPLPVKGYYNGIVSMPIEAFLLPTLLWFRGIPDSLAQFYLGASECCLIHADNPLSRTGGVDLNPHVRVGYTSATYGAVHSFWLPRRWATLTFFQNFVAQRRVALWQYYSKNRHEI